MINLSIRCQIVVKKLMLIIHSQKPVLASNIAASSAIKWKAQATYIKKNTIYQAIDGPIARAIKMNFACHDLRMPMSKYYRFETVRVMCQD